MMAGYIELSYRRRLGLLAEQLTVMSTAMAGGKAARELLRKLEGESR